MYDKGDYFLQNLTCSTIGYFYSGGKLETLGGKFMIYFLAGWKVEVFSSPAPANCIKIFI